MNPCPYCAAPMANRRRKQCGAPECRRRYTADRMREYQRTRYQQDPSYRERMNARHEVTCVHCGTTWKTRRKSATYCSAACQAAHQWGTSEERGRQARKAARWRKATRRAARAATGTAGRVRWRAGRCLRCEQGFISSQPGVGYCSVRCRKKGAKERRRARQYEAYVEPVRRIQIFHRDGWICQLCDLPVDRGAAVPHPLAATLDHIIPLARGGTHEPSNVQLAHFLCNCTKSDQTAIAA